MQVVALHTPAVSCWISRVMLLEKVQVSSLALFAAWKQQKYYRSRALQIQNRRPHEFTQKRHMDDHPKLPMSTLVATGPQWCWMGLADHVNLTESPQCACAVFPQEWYNQWSLSRPDGVERHGLIYAGAQHQARWPSSMHGRNYRTTKITTITPTTMQYHLMAQKESLYNTPPTYVIYMMGLVFLASPLTGWFRIRWENRILPKLY
jgi:hypothetical protein